MLFYAWLNLLTSAPAESSHYTQDTCNLFSFIPSGFIGPSRSGTAMSVARFLKERSLDEQKMVQILYSATAESLSNKTDFPFIFRTIASDTYQIKVRICLSNYLPVYLSTYLSIYLSIYPYSVNYRNLKYSFCHFYCHMIFY